ncbi:hypothetical protein B0T17DRAFT_521928 [Bombardia bombarda]|uniref:N-acetyltransferase domain-containing protein n=1 Tax=Bombardia bombarda TaxID=252184 RepID=A0AA39X6E4_9PEZI|nr:hypothetical protein B0T17DRAFT_521928 [Bombardia bombarda]
MKCDIKVIPLTEDGIVFYLSKYKPFRLRALECDPSSFGSNYAREAAFKDNEWAARLLNPLATTFVAVVHTDDYIDKHGGEQKKTTSVLSSATLWGPIPVSPDHLRLPRPNIDNDSDVPMHWEITGVWTAPEARRQGIAVQLLQEAARTAHSQTTSQNRDCHLTVNVMHNNATAILLYKRCGYTETISPNNHGQGPKTEQEPLVHLALLLPRAQGA